MARAKGPRSAKDTEETFIDAFSGSSFSVVGPTGSAPRPGNRPIESTPSTEKWLRDAPVEDKANNRLFVAISVVIAALAGVGYWYVANSDPDEDPVIEKQYYTVTRGDITISVDAVGTVKPEHVIELKSRASGTVQIALRAWRRGVSAGAQGTRVP